MIKPGEIDKIAIREGVRATQIQKDYAIQMIEKMIEGHTYLSKKSETYNKTARTMIQKGMERPLYLK